MDTDLEQIKKTSVSERVRRATKVASAIIAVVVFFLTLGRGSLEDWIGSLILAVLAYFAPWFVVRTVFWVERGQRDAPTSSPRSEDIASPSPRPLRSASASPAESSANEEALYARAHTELDTSARRPGLWAKALAESEGNESLAKAKYLRWRVEQLSRQRD